MTKFYFALVGGHPSPELNWDEEVTVEASSLEEAEKKVKEMYMWDESAKLVYLVERP